MHERFAPKGHKFVYPIFALRLDLNELEESPASFNSFVFGINKKRLLSLRIQDYGPRDGTSLINWANSVLHKHGLNAPKRIELHTMPRLFGYAFNPISIWYCYDESDQLVSVIAEVNNTFGEHHFYVLRDEFHSAISSQSQLCSVKAMHVSPFCEVKGHYEFQFKDSNKHAVVHIDYYQEKKIVIKTAMASRKVNFTSIELLKAFTKQPFLTMGVFWRIHWQAFLLWLKGVPFYRLPAAPQSNITLGTSLKEER
ncbi:DUF1365 domain-containing protein [Undibacterium cyanobacteriorum]